MADWKNESQARDEIKSLVAEYYNKFKKNEDKFIPGNRINYVYHKIP